MMRRGVSLLKKALAAQGGGSGTRSRPGRVEMMSACNVW